MLLIDERDGDKLKLKTGIKANIEQFITLMLVICSREKLISNNINSDDSCGDMLTN